ncbi:class I SAM-dependent DNA methyltransferase [Pseudanabaena yagii GIHE-NHR1]|uniref:site-specific DNA-methyltransferase (adenine-specific) n=1 Tax=Pseudanabaena yagii GIHE-NHR1 TaxID=2722753 RepID=A0ABX1LL93_9CYAN|nr:class I SAM-dependent DNA methyltransferase [Pseudanabaena yagii GIHE-NHR1]
MQAFLAKWQGSQGNERANYQTFFDDLCGALGVERPIPKGTMQGDPYCFDKEIKVFHKEGIKTNFVDFHREGHFLIEAKQGSDKPKQSSPKRGTESYLRMMEKAFYQALSYTPFLNSKPPFLMTCDIGSHFELWMSFSGNYGGYGAREVIPLEDLLKEKVFDRFVAIFSDPQSLNPEKYRARVTREVAGTLAKLAKWLEEQGKEPQEVANFLMRCIFTMFAEDVRLLQGEIFTRALQERWIPEPSRFKAEIEDLWKVMNTGGKFNFDAIPQFNGSFFANAIAFDLPKEQLEVLYDAAQKDWREVEPAIFGTLLERALEKKERSRLGAHYTPRSYVERLVRPVVMEPLREEWLLVETEVNRLLVLKDGQEEPTKSQRDKAAVEIRAFLERLQQVRILDPACGSGNFLYVTLDLIKTLEQEVQMRLLDVLGKVTTDLLEEFDPRLAGRKQVNPSQFLGIEINPRAAAIAELVIWIGYLQWHFKRYGTTPPPEPILQDFHNIEFRDAVLAYDGRELDVDAKTGKVRSRWGGRTMRHPVTGEDVPDPSDQVPIYRYINPRPAVWQEADYIVSNPPFIGNKRMRDRLGDGYVDALRATHGDISDTVDFVMYWWNQSAKLVIDNKLKSFGLITTNSITQTFNRKVLHEYLSGTNPISLTFAIPDHPWIDSADGAAVRIAITVGKLGKHEGNLIKVAKEIEGENEISLIFTPSSRGLINSDLSVGADVASAKKLRANSILSGQGVIVLGEGFQLNEEEYLKLLKQEPQGVHLVKRYRNGKDITDKPRNLRIIDLYGLTELQVKQYPYIYQRIYELVRPKRLEMKDKARREQWWLFGRSNQEIRNAINELDRYIITCRTAKHRVFVFAEGDILPDAKLIAFGLNDAFYLGILSSSCHLIWASKSGAWLGVGNDSNYNHSECFGKFPFPDATLEQKEKIRQLGERLDRHRKQVQAQHPEITITGMYNLLEKLRKGEDFTDKDREYNNKALVSTLKQIHDDLDNAVLEAYGWEDLKPSSLHQTTDSPPSPPILGGTEQSNQSKSPSIGGFRGLDKLSGESLTEIILDRLVTLNAQRAEEERNGHIRWLRPEYQAPNEVRTQTIIEGVGESEEVAIAPAEVKTFPKQPKDQLAAIRDLLRTSNNPWTIAQIAAQFKNGGRYKNAISENLERLEWFGILHCHQDGQIKYWQHIETQQAS